MTLDRPVEDGAAHHLQQPAYWRPRGSRPSEAVACPATTQGMVCHPGSAPAPRVVAFGYSFGGADAAPRQRPRTVFKSSLTAAIMSAPIVGIAFS